MSDQKPREFPICDHCKNTGVHLCPDVAQPILVSCDSKACPITKLRADLDLAIEALKRLSEVSKSPGHPSFNDMEIVGKFVDETLAKLQERK